LNLSSKPDQSKSGKFPKWLFFASFILLLLLVSAVIYMGGHKGGPGRSLPVEKGSLEANVPSDQAAIPENRVESSSGKLCPKPLLWNIGARQMYDYELETDITLDPSVMAGQPIAGDSQKKKVKMTIKGTLNFRIFGSPKSVSGMPGEKKKIIYVGFQLSPVQVNIYGKPGAEGTRAPDLEKLYQTFFVVAYVKEGAPALFYFPEQLDEKDKTSLSEIVKIVQMVVPLENLSNEWDDQGVLRWKEDETHAVGLFESEYFVRKDECDSIHKKNIRCLSLQAMEDQTGTSERLKLTGHVVKSEFKGIIAPESSWLKEFSGSEVFEIQAEKGVWSESQVSINLRLRNFDPDSSLPIWNETRSAKEIIESFIMSGKKQGETTGAWEKRRLQSLAEKLEDLSVSQIMLEIKNAAASGASQSDLATLSHTLRDFLELYPEEADSIPPLLKERNLTGKAAGSVLLALELVGHPEAQTALKDVFEDNDQISDNRLRAIVAAGGIAKSEEELVESLFNLSEAGREGGNDDDLERADTSLLALGILSYSLSKGEEPAESNAINERIVTSLQRSEDKRERVMCLKALGNTSNPDIISAIEPYLTSESAAERAASAGSLRNFSDEHTLELLVDSMEDDPESGVRKAAISALSDRGGIGIVEPVCRHLPNEPDDYLRRMMVSVLGKNKTPEVVDTLKKQLEVETSSEVAKEIYRVLYGK